MPDLPLFVPGSFGTLGANLHKVMAALTSVPSANKKAGCVRLAGRPGMINRTPAQVVPSKCVHRRTIAGIHGPSFGGENVGDLGSEI